MDEKGERIPLTICDYDREAGTITIVFQPVGASTTKMKELKAGDYFRDFTGPLGNASELVEEDIEELKKKKILFVGGGVGAAPVYPQVKWLHEHGVDADVISARRVPRSRMLLVSFLVSTPDIPGILYSSITSERVFVQRKFDGLSLYSLTISPPTVGIFVSKSSSAIP